MTSFLEFLRARLNQTPFSTTEVLACWLPLARQVAATHETGRVAPLENVDRLFVEDGAIVYAASDELPGKRGFRDVNQLLRSADGGIDVVAERRQVHDVDQGLHSDELLIGASSPQAGVSAQHLPEYRCCEHTVGHHDPISDIYSLGLILVSLACELDLTRKQDFVQFVEHRRNLFRINPDLHPVLARSIVLMTELNRKNRPQDLPALIASIENYRDQDVDFETDLASEQASAENGSSSRRQVVLQKLQERLFEINRRNRLLQFRSSLQTLNLTHSSIPVAFNAAQIKADDVLTWNGEFQESMLRQRPVSLNRFLNFQEAVYVPIQLDRLRAEARRDQTEYGFAQLKLIICFLRWSDLKAKPVERYESPLLLLPVELTVKKGIHDRYSLKLLDDQAEVNPVIRHLFRQLYEIELPQTVAADQHSMTHFFETLQQQIQASGKSVELTRIDKPRIEIIHEKARRRLDQFRRRARTGRGVREFLDLNYSYDPVSYEPLGYQLFKNYIVPSRTRLESIVTTKPPGPNRFHPAAEEEEGQAQTAETEKTFYALKSEGDDNPFHWEFDLCSVTLANLRYRRMSLVNDYSRLIDDDIANPAFEETFSIAPVKVDRAEKTPELKDRYHVVSCDPTQMAAVHRARSGESYIIQGPPGTGKSQTITNLIADFVVRGKRVLFVCEKRAAIDVVYHRLKQQGVTVESCVWFEG